jgi:CheY-like chemotaxis protein
MSAGPVVLIVDDEPSVRTLVRSMLEREGWASVEARDGGEAIALLSTTVSIDLLITDLMMPVMNGKELAGAVRMLRPKLPVLYLTGHSEMLFASVPVLGDGEAFLDKPFSRRALLEAVSLLFFGTTQPLANPEPSWAARARSFLQTQPPPVPGGDFTSSDDADFAELLGTSR